MVLRVSARNPVELCPTVNSLDRPSTFVLGKTRASHSRNEGICFSERYELGWGAYHIVMKQKKEEWSLSARPQQLQGGGRWWTKTRRMGQIFALVLVLGDAYSVHELAHGGSRCERERENEALETAVILPLDTTSPCSLDVSPAPERRGGVCANLSAYSSLEGDFERMPCTSGTVAVSSSSNVPNDATVFNTRKKGGTYTADADESLSPVKSRTLVDFLDDFGISLILDYKYICYKTLQKFDGTT
ncbi:hypothetical protein C8R43DRAFT_961260 [Mycena crocata]|nr:hypothetical protein C8R43DRAFT_961260 [Mycena crocata]